VRAPLPCGRLEPHRRPLQRGTERPKDWFSAPIAYGRKRRGYYYTGRFRVRRCGSGGGEALALFFAPKLLVQCRGIPFEACTNRAMACARSPR